MNWMRFSRRLSLGWALASVVACGGDASDGERPGTDGPSDPMDNNDSTDSTANPLAPAFPTDLAFASPTVRDPMSATRRGLGTVRRSLSFGPPSAYEAKVERLATILAGTTVADCSFELDLVRGGPGASCYGPRLTYTNHPEAPNPDADAVDGDTGFRDMDGDGELPSGDLGLWQSTEGPSNEACAAATLNARVGEVEGLADSAVFAMASMICLANVSGTTLPADGSGVDITSLVASGFSSNGSALTVSTASISEGDGIYTSVLEASTASGGTAQRFFCRLRHRSGANGVTYTGKLSCVIESDTGMKPGNCDRPELSAGETDALSIAYQKNSASIFSYELRSASYCGSTGVDPWVSATDFTVDPSRKLNLPMDPGADDLTGWANNFQQARFQFNVNAGGGLYNFAWQAGTRDGHTRVLNVAMESEDQEVGHEGCGYFGFGPDISDEADYGEIDGMICNWAGPGHTMPRSPVAAVQRQCFAFDETSGVYQPDVARENIVYAPTNSCDSSGADGLGHPFSFTDGTTTVTGPVANDLFPLADMPDVSAPAPANVDL